MNTLMGILAHWLHDPRLWSGALLVLHAAFLLALGLLLRAFWRANALGRVARLPKPAGGFALPMVLLAVLFGALLVHQASWQLTGLYRPRFVAFMQLHDRRQFNPAHWIERGRILDRRGEPLAYSEARDGEVRRVYPEGPVFAPVVGYASPRFGTTGMEAVGNLRLNGAQPLAATRAQLPDWGELGRRIVTQEKRSRGQDLRLTLDARLQRRAVELLDGHRGAVVVLDAASGAVRALASLPSHDPNRIGAALLRNPGPGTPFLNRATQGLYPPGSTFKIVIADLALEHGFSGTLDCPAEGYATSAGYRKIRDHEYYSARRQGHSWAGFGRIGLERALAVSSNVFFAQLGVGYGHDAFYALAERLRLNQPIAWHREAGGGYGMRTGALPRIANSDRYGLAQIAIGQGALQVTPAYMALLAAAVANGGMAMRPRLIADSPPQTLGRFMSTAAATQLARMLRGVVTAGTARGIETPALTIAGKTGTAQNSQGAPHSWFVGFAPAQGASGRQLAIAVLVEHGGYGSAVAAPIARDLLLEANRLGLMR